MNRIERLAPLIGATVTGPIGVAHLPRMWLKSVLSAAGMLPEEYFDNDKGFNHRVVDALGLEPDAWFAFLATMPTYPEAETYVRAHATKLDPATIAALNDGIRTFQRPEESAAGVRARVGLDDPAFRNSAQLLDLDDWFTMHQALLAQRDGGLEPIVPMVSSSQTGVIGIPHLPRLWFKALLNAAHALPAEWKTGMGCGFDKRLSGVIGLDLPAACAFIDSEFPNYLQFEAWVRDNIAPADDATKARWLAEFLAFQKSAEQAAEEVVEAGATDPTLSGTILLNDLVDWKHMRDYVASKLVAP